MIRSKGRYYSMTRFFYLFLLLSVASNGSTLLVLGDSLSASYGISEENGWVQLLSADLEPQYKIVNASISGDTSGNGLARLPRLLEEFNPNYVLIELGANDGLRGHPLKLLKTNIEKMILMCQDKNIEPLLFGMEIPANYGRRYSGNFAAIYPSLALQFKIPLMPFQFEDLASSESMIQADGLHPSLEAQKIIKSRVKSFLTPILKLEPGL